MRSYKTYLKPVIGTIATLSIVGCGEFDRMPQAQVGQLAQFLDVSGPPRYSALAAGSDEQGPSRAAAEAKCNSIYSDLTKNAERRAACVKMFMAQYYSSIDKSFTVSGTIIEWADSETPLGKSARPYYQAIYDSSGTRLIGVKRFEAIWDKDGAVCLLDPRHMGLHYFNKPTDHNLPKCSVDPRNLSVPWLNNPFPGNGQQMISYRINHVATRFLIMNKTNGNIGPCEVMCSEPNQEVIETVFSPSGSYPSAPLRRKLHLTDPPQYEEDPDRYIKAKIWKSCDSSPSVHCDYITTAYDLSKSDIKRALHLPDGKTFVLWDPSDLNAIWLFKNETEPGASGIHTWRVELGGRYYYITATESGIEKLGGRDPRKLWSEGFVYPNIVN